MLKRFTVFLVMVIVFPYSAYAELFSSPTMGIQFKIAEGWEAFENKTTQKVVVVHKSKTKANCIIARKIIPGLEVLSKEELKKFLDNHVSNPETIISMLKGAKKFSHVKVTDTNLGLVDNWSYVDHFIDIADRNITSTKTETIYIDKKIRLRFVYTNHGGYRYTCTAKYGDFDVTNKAFNIILGTMKSLKP